MIMTSLVYTIQPSPACSSLLPVGYSTTKRARYPFSTRASSCYSSVYNPTKGLHISLGPNPSILRLFSLLSSNISDLTNLVILTLQECLPFRLHILAPSHHLTLSQVHSNGLSIENHVLQPLRPLSPSIQSSPCDLSY